MGEAAHERVVVGVGLEDTERAEAIVRTARRFGGTGAELKLVHVHRLRQMAVMDYTYVEPPERVAKELDKETAVLQSLAAKVDGPTSVEVMIGNPVDALLQTVKGAALVVIGRTHLGLLSRVLQGSVESRLVHESPCPVLIVP